MSTSKPGRPSIFDKPLTAAERQSRVRLDRQIKLDQAKANLAEAHKLLRAAHAAFTQGRAPTWNEQTDFIDAVSAIEAAQELLGSNRGS